MKTITETFKYDHRGNVITHTTVTIEGYWKTTTTIQRTFNVKNQITDSHTTIEEEKIDWCLTDKKKT